MKIVAILQARMGSTRLPGKSMLPLAGKPMVQNIIERVQRATRLDAVVLAVPWQEDFCAVAKATNCSVSYSVDENDLVRRYCEAAERTYDADIIVRVCCDNPCIDPAFIDDAIEQYLRYPFVFYTNTVVQMTPTRTLDGIGCEVLSRSRLHWLDQVTQGNPTWREHPHKYFYDHGLASDPIATHRLDVNTREEYEKIAALYDHFGHNRFTTQDILAYYA
jgi:spore coat polysaccharide biosynthesis protein SpsF